MAETLESVEDSPREEDDESPREDDDRESLLELLEQLALQLGALVLLETQRAASRHKPELRRAARDVAAAVVAAVAFLTAFALANAAAVGALTPTLSDWEAPLVLAAAWLVVGVLLALLLAARARRIAASQTKDADEARAEAVNAVRETLERLVPMLSKEIALAAVPMAGDVAGGIVDTGGDLIESADDIVEAMVEDVPGGGAINQMWDVVLMPGRFGVRVATTVLRRTDSGGDGSDAREQSL